MKTKGKAQVMIARRRAGLISAYQSTDIKSEVASLPKIRIADYPLYVFCDMHLIIFLFCIVYTFPNEHVSSECKVCGEEMPSCVDRRGTTMAGCY